MQSLRLEGKVLIHMIMCSYIQSPLVVMEIKFAVSAMIIIFSASSSSWSAAGPYHALLPLPQPRPLRSGDRYTDSYSRDTDSYSRHTNSCNRHTDSYTDTWAATADTPAAADTPGSCSRHTGGSSKRTDSYSRQTVAADAQVDNRHTEN